jgi:DNA-binding beta-propeller fold protein YncE
MNKILLPLFLLLFSQLNGQSKKELKFTPSPDFLKMPMGWYLQEVSGVAINSKDHIFIFHRGKHPLMEFDSEGNFIRSIAEDLFVRPHGIRIDKYDNIWTTDVGSHVVLKFDPTLKLKLILGKWNAAGVQTSRYNLFAHLFDMPTDVAFDSQDNVYVTDGYGNSRVVKFDREGVFIKAWGSKGTAPGQFDVPHTIVIDDADLLYIGDRQNQRIQIFNANGDFIRAWENIGYACGLVLYKDKFYMTDILNGTLTEFSTEGKVTGTYGSIGKRSGQFEWPHMIAVDSKGSLYIAEIQTWRVQKLSREK